MMTREERLKFCSICQKRQMDMQRGLVCSLTNEYATFDEKCTDFEADETAIAKELTKSSVSLTKKSQTSPTAMPSS